jgi:hypothetical protein
MLRLEQRFDGYMQIWCIGEQRFDSHRKSASMR